MRHDRERQRSDTPCVRAYTLLFLVETTQYYGRAGTAYLVGEQSQTSPVLLAFGGRLGASAGAGVPHAR